jgi:hypothetical protein
MPAGKPIAAIHGMRGFAALGARFPKARSKSLGERDE